MTIEKKSLISALKTTKKANAVKEDISGNATMTSPAQKVASTKNLSKVPASKYTALKNLSKVPATKNTALKSPASKNTAVKW